MIKMVKKYAREAREFVPMEAVAETWEFHEDGSPAVLDYNLFDDLRKMGWYAND